MIVFKTAKITVLCVHISLWRMVDRWSLMARLLVVVAVEYIWNKLNKLIKINTVERRSYKKIRKDSVWSLADNSITRITPLIIVNNC